MDKELYELTDDTEVSEPKPTPSKFLLPVWDDTKSEEENMKVFNAWWNM
jgi:hypothetical protein